MEYYGSDPAIAQAFNWCQNDEMRRVFLMAFDEQNYNAHYAESETAKQFRGKLNNASWDLGSEAKGTWNKYQLTHIQFADKTEDEEAEVWRWRQYVATIPYTDYVDLK